MCYCIHNPCNSILRKRVDVAGAAAVAASVAVAAVALASVDVEASAAGTTKQPTYLFLMLLTELKKYQDIT
jgi:hypothetical protein